MGSVVSFLAGIVLLIVACLVMKAYWPKGNRSQASSDLGMAIFLGFLAAALNTLWWQIGGTVSREMLHFEYFQEVGLWLDGLFKGLAALSGYYHLKALRNSLGEKDKSRWAWYEMPWYPRGCSVRFRKGKKDDEEA